MTPAGSTALVAARRIGIVIAFVMVLVRPGIGQAEAPTQLSDVDVILVLDQTRSMAALDHDTRRPRIEGAQEDLLSLVEELPGARFGMITFGAEARLTLPLTTDAVAFEAGVQTISLEGPRDGNGSNANRPVAELEKVLERAEEQRPERRRFVIYVGDGEDTTDGGDQDFADVADLISGGAVLGYGTTKGASMPAANDLDTDRGYVRDPETGSTAISKADPDNLEEIADDLGVDFFHRTGPGGISRVTDAFEAAYAFGADGDRRPAKHDLTWLFGLLLLGLVLFELRAGWRAAWAAPHALAPRQHSRPGNGAQQ